MVNRLHSGQGAYVTGISLVLVGPTWREAQTGAPVVWAGWPSPGESVFWPYGFPLREAAVRYNPAGGSGFPASQNIFPLFPAIYSNPRHQPSAIPFRPRCPSRGLLRAVQHPLVPNRSLRHIATYWFPWPAPRHSVLPFATGFPPTTPLAPAAYVAPWRARD